MRESEKFFNEGFGWVCRHCALDQPKRTDERQISRLLREGESEGKIPKLSTVALARWTDSSHTALECPRCGTMETLPTE